MKNILIVRTDRLGDLILTLPMAEMIKKQLPNATVTFAVNEYTKPIAESCQFVDHIVLLDRSMSMIQTVTAIRKIHADCIIFPSLISKQVIAAFIARVPIRIGTGFRWYSIFINRRINAHRKTAEKNEAEYNADMLKEIGLQTNDVPFPILSIEHQLQYYRPYAVIHIFTGGSSPQWDEKYYQSLIVQLIQHYDLDVILTGELKHREFLLTFIESMKPYRDRIHIRTNMTLLELGSLLYDAKLMIAGSTGPAHLAAALGTATIGIFPMVIPLSKQRWGLRGKNVINLAPDTYVRSECPHCRGCDCINTITPDIVLNAATKLLNNDK